MAPSAPEQVNSIDPRAVTRDEVVGVVSRTPRCDKAGCGEEDPWDVFTLDLAGEPGQELGLRVLGKRYSGAVLKTACLSPALRRQCDLLRKYTTFRRVRSVNYKNMFFYLSLP